MVKLWKVLNTVAKRSKHAEHAPRDQHRKRPGVHKKSQNKNEKRQKNQNKYIGQGK